MMAHFRQVGRFFGSSAGSSATANGSETSSGAFGSDADSGFVDTWVLNAFSTSRAPGTSSMGSFTVKVCEVWLERDMAVSDGVACCGRGGLRLGEGSTTDGEPGGQLQRVASLHYMVFRRDISG